MSDSNSIRDVLNGMRPRVQTIRTGAAAAPPSSRPLLDDALTELRTAMEELQVSEEELRVQAEAMAEQQFGVEADLARYRELFRLSPEARLVTDTDGVVREANDAAGRLLRSRSDALAGKPLAVFVPEEERREFRAVLRRLAHHEAVEAEMRLLPHRSLPLDVEVTAAARSARVGGPVEVHWTLRDVTDRHAAAAAGVEAAEVHRAVVECSPVPTVAMDLDGTVLLWNSAAAALLGWSADEVAGRRNPALAEDEVARSREAAGLGGEGRAVLARRRDGAPVPATLRDALLKGADGRTLGVVCTLLPVEQGDEAEDEPHARAAAGHPAEDEADAGQARWTRDESLAVLRAGA
ncbi:MAG: sensor hybrid histidine kinase, partial [Gemmatimonadetes bacterium]|nr:sensor hybrid histidine kinase [Gemmatimonadota bacterium]